VSGVELDEARASAVVEVMRLAYLRGLTQVKGGNVSFADRARGVIYITPSGVPKYSLKPGDVAIVTFEGERVRGVPSVEFMMHLQIYRRIGESQAIVHVHPPYTLALVGSGIQLELGYLSEAKLKVRCYTRVPPLKPGSLELAEATAKALAETGCNVAILDDHGVVAYSPLDPFDALDTVESIEDLAKIVALRRVLGSLKS